MDQELERQLTAFLKEPIIKTRSLSGGDISDAYLLHTRNGRLFCKVNNSTDAFAMFKAEKEGLKVIAKSGVIKAPAVICCSPLKKGACLILEYIEDKSPSAKDMQKFGYQLAELHLCRGAYFGLEEANYIGSLPQSNTTHSSWVSFYARERLQPQLELALEKSLLSANEVPEIHLIENTIAKYSSDITPVLLHGDLWSGNYLISDNGDPHLIDPAIYYGHSEVDMAMTKLFGGFDADFYMAYHEIIPTSDGYAQRQELYQLYYLLVHLNLFGSSYYPAVVNSINRYF